MIHYLYTLIDPRTRMVRYVGQTTNVKERYYQHSSSTSLRKSYVGSWLKGLLQTDIKPILGILSVETENTWVKAEQFWILYFKELGYPLTNLTNGGEGTIGITRSPEWREKLRKANLGKKFTTKHKSNISAGLKRHPRKPLSPQEIKRVRNLNLGKTFSLETRERMRKSHLGKLLPSTTKKRISIAVKQDWVRRKQAIKTT